MEGAGCRWISCTIEIFLFASLSTNWLLMTNAESQQSLTSHLEFYEKTIVQNVPPVNEAVISEFDVPIHAEVSSSGGRSYVFPYSFFPNEAWTINVCIESANATEEVPLLAVVRQSQSIMSWQVPLAFANSNSCYSKVCHTLCPLRNYVDPSIRPGHQNLYIDITANSVLRTEFTLLASNVTDFIISTNEQRSLNITPSVPKVQEYHMADDLDSVLVQATSSDDLCMTLAIEDIECPFYDTQRKLELKGFYQTMINKGGITVDRNSFKDGKVYIVMILDDNDQRCTYNTDTTSVGCRKKEVLLTVKPKISNKEFNLAVLRVFGIFISFYIVAIIASVVIHFRTPKREAINPSLNNEGGRRNRNYGSTSVGDDTRPLSAIPIIEVLEDEQYLLSSEEGQGEYEVISRTQDQQTVLHGADLEIEKEKRLEERARIYPWNVVTIAIFYGIPVVQLVYTNQKIINLTGNQDVCYYNFLCSHKRWIFSDFNHIYSNIGYVMLGILFLMLVFRKDVLRCRRMHEMQTQRKEVLPGIVHHFGLFYAMGWALIMEGVLSASYHVCPNKANFQFDTAFMYVISAMCMLQLYQLRNRDITARPHIACLALAVIVFVGLISEAQTSVYFFIIFSLVHIIFTMLLSIYIYNMGCWKLDTRICTRISGFYRKLKNDFRNGRYLPKHIGRFVLLTIAVTVNIAMDLYGLASEPSDFATFLLAIFIVNLLLYLSYYIIMKIYYKEHILWISWLFMLLSILCWIFAVIYFLTKNTEWEMTPALSRNENKACVIWNFYDDHDIWHMLSSCALFCSFMVLFTLDNALEDTPNNQIPIF